jgi:hypothetical protein
MRGRLICEVGLYASIYSKYLSTLSMTSDGSACQALHESHFTACTRGVRGLFPHGPTQDNKEWTLCKLEESLQNNTKLCHNMCNFLRHCGE